VAFRTRLLIVLSHPISHLQTHPTPPQAISV
jgi:hypothetical protein